ncbi:MAG: mannitol-1-phosphate 5-dehydrogenase [Intestinibacter sp.]|uniref:mannitol-1-phosphate 5-dehydrogenase n=1 Tax=Intestinibacter sp. TaxID=1965304 RepID=UPI0025B97214|nr:mannitol-1-phosphate 5-dehydrogenase [Intestinibacter sp.]MCI6738079.1 mannitol-1-phosphate 5-dehydrogenase [Intestinibacter sp.]
MKKAIQFGAGNIGRGFIGGLLSNSGYHVVFADVNETILNGINNEKQYKILVKDVECFDQTITNISAVSSITDDIIKEIEEAEIITTAVGPLILKRIAPTIAKGIQARKNDGNKNYLNIIACENAVGATAILKEEVLKCLNEEEVAYLEEYVGFPNCSVDRIVPPCTNENPLDVTVENFYEWNVEEAKIKGEIPQIEGMNLVGDLIAYVERKLFTLNTGHAITAYLGTLKGYKTIDEAIKDEEIATIVKAAMQESGQGLVKKHGLDLEAHYKYIDKILNRFKNPYLNDDVKRVGREPLRKLSAKDRLVNPLMTAKSYGISVDNLIIGVGAALHYNNEEDAQSVELQQTIKDLGVKEAVKKISAIEDEELLNAIEKSYNDLAK